MQTQSSQQPVSCHKQRLYWAPSASQIATAWWNESIELAYPGQPGSEYFSMNLCYFCGLPLYLTLLLVKFFSQKASWTVPDPLFLSIIVGGNAVTRLCVRHSLCQIPPGFHRRMHLLISKFETWSQSNPNLIILHNPPWGPCIQRLAKCGGILSIKLHQLLWLSKCSSI